MGRNAIVSQSGGATAVINASLAGVLAAAALARGEDCEGADLICLPEVPFDMDRFIEKINSLHKDHPAVVVAAEGIRTEEGWYAADSERSVSVRDGSGGYPPECKPQKAHSAGMDQQQ